MATLLVAVSVLLAAMLPLSENPWGHDGSIHTANVLLLAQALHDGEWLPRWLPELNGGLGGPNFRYYSFFSYFPAALAHELAGLDLLAAVRLACRAYFAFGFLGAGLLAWHLFGRGAALVVPPLFSLSPYALVLLQARLALPEYAALNLAPWLFLALSAWSRTGKSVYSLLVSLQFALLLCLHNLAAILWSPFLFLCGAFGWKHGTRRALCGLWSLAAGVFIAAFQFGPSMLELHWIDASRQIQDIDLFSTWALPFGALLSNRPDEGFSARLVPGPISIAVALIGSLSLLLQLRRGNKPPGTSHYRDFVIYLLLGLMALFLTTRVSAAIATILPPLSYVQFPWRFLGPFSFFAAMVGGALFAPLSTPLKAAAAICLLIVGWGLILPGYGAPIPSASPVRAIQDFGNTVYTGDFENKYLPMGARLLPVPVGESILVPASARLFSVEIRRNFLAAEIEADGSVQILVRRYWFPGWRADLDGHEVSVGRNELNGEITVTLPAGRHVLRIHRGWDPLGWLYASVSLAAILACVGTLFLKRDRLLLWVPCLAASLATVCWGLLSPEGFRPPLDLKRAMENDRLGGEQIAAGWSVLHYPGRTAHFGQPTRGLAGALNLGPGGALRDGTAVWAAELWPVPQSEIVLEYKGDVVLLLDGKRLDTKDATEGGFHGLKMLPIPSERLEAASGSYLRVVVVASGIDRGAVARLLLRARGKDGRWQLIPSELLRPAANKGFLELFTNLFGDTNE